MRLLPGSTPARHLSRIPPRAKDPRRAARERPAARAAAALLLSAAANGAGIVALHGAGALRLPGRESPVDVALAPVGAAEWEARRRIADADAAAIAGPASPTVAPASPTVPPGHVVRVAPSPDTRRPDHARFLAERDNTVRRETQWRGTPDRSLPIAARRTTGADGAQGVPLPGEEGRADASEPGREGEPAPDAEERIARARLALAEQGLAAGSGAPARAGPGGLRRAGRFDPRILPVADAFAAAGAGSPSGERLPGVASGDETLVNTHAFKYAAFYRRVFDAVQSEWRPNDEWDARDRHDRVLGRQARKAVVNLVLDPDGRLRETRLVQGSGLEFFDRECLRAVAAAAPFPNPPRGLVGPDGLVVVPVPLLFEWGPDALLDRLLPGR